MGKYSDDIKENVWGETKVRNLGVGYKWAEYLANVKNKNANDDYQKQKTPENKTIIHNVESRLFPGDTGIGVTGVNDLLRKIKTQDKITAENKLLINWEKYLY